MTVTVFDCARVPKQTCSIQIIGDRDEVLEAAKAHLISAHGHTDNDQLTKDVTGVVDEKREEIPYAHWGG